VRKLLNTLHVMTPGMYLHRDGETVSVKLGSELKLRVPVHTLEGLVCWGPVSCSPPLLGLCCEKGVGVSFLTERAASLPAYRGLFRAMCSSAVNNTALPMAASRRCRLCVRS
jgi:CRISPR-associated protein Cas1